MAKKKIGNPEFAYGIPKAIYVGYEEPTDEERKRGRKEMEKFLLALGVIKPGQNLEDVEEKLDD